MDSQGAEPSELAVQEQAAGSMTPTVLAPPEDETDAPEVRKVNEQIVPPCVKLTDWLAMLTEPVRDDVESELDVTVTLTEPLPVPADGLTVTNGFSLEAAHVQFAPFALIFFVTVPAPTEKGLPSEEVSSVMLHAIPGCVIWNGTPPMVRKPDRFAVVEF